MLRIAIYVSDHGYGHASRMAALAREFTGFGIYTVVRSCRPDFLFSGLDSSYFRKHDFAVDVGVKHHPDLATDLPSTRAALIQLMEQRGSITEREVEFLRSEEIDLAIADVPFLVAEICAYAGIPCFAVSNFDWLYVYHGLFRQDGALRPLLNTIFGLYQRFDAAFLLPFGSRRGMGAFPRLIKTGLLARSKDHYTDIRKEMGIAAETSILAVTFGGAGEMQFDLQKVCAAFAGVVLSRIDCESHNHRKVVKEQDWLDIMRACDVLLTKPGYSTFAEATQFGKYILYHPREGYPEEELLRAGLKSYARKLEIPSLDNSVEVWKKIFGKVNAHKQDKVECKNQNSRVAADLLAEFMRIRKGGHEYYSVYDIGSNNLNYVLWDKTEREVLHSAQLTTGLGRGMNFRKGKWHVAANSARTFKRCFNQLHTWESKIEAERFILSASVARRAENFPAIRDWIKGKTGMDTLTISETAESKYAWLAASTTMHVGKRPLVIDIGGLSTELVWGIGKHNSYSIPFGLLSVLKGDDSSGFSACLDQLFIQHDLAGRQVICTGLTGAYLARQAKQMGAVPLIHTHGIRVQAAELQQVFYEALRSAPGADPDAAMHETTRILRASSTLLIQILDRLSASYFVVCYYGISTGYAIWKFSKGKRSDR